MLIEEIKKLRKSQKISQTEMAGFLTMAQTTYSDIENGISKLTIEDFLKICKKLEIDPILLVKESKEVLISVTPTEAKALNSLNTKIQNNFSIQNVNVKTSGDVIIGKNIKNK